MSDRLHVLVLGGGPDRERPVSFCSAAAVADALRRAGHTVVESDIGPGDASALDPDYDVIFPVLHGRFGEGGPLQHMLEGRGKPYVGSGPHASAVAMDKRRTKEVATECGVPTPPHEVVSEDAPPTLDPPLVLKPLAEGSSIEVHFCEAADELSRARRELHRTHASVLAERRIAGREVTVGIVGEETLPPVEIRAAEGFYDYAAKYERDDTTYLLEVDLPSPLLSELRRHAWAVHEALGCRDVSRCDFVVDGEPRPWLLEINTMPGFTDHSLVPKAAAHAGMPMEVLCDRLVRDAVARARPAA